MISHCEGNGDTERLNNPSKAIYPSDKMGNTNRLSSPCLICSGSAVFLYFIVFQILKYFYLFRYNDIHWEGDQTLHIQFIYVSDIPYTHRLYIILHVFIANHCMRPGVEFCTVVSCWCSQFPYLGVHWIRIFRLEVLHMYPVFI